MDGAIDGQLAYPRQPKQASHHAFSIAASAFESIVCCGAHACTGFELCFLLSTINESVPRPLLCLISLALFAVSVVAMPVL